MHLERGLDGRNVAAVGIDGILWQMYCSDLYIFFCLAVSQQNPATGFTKNELTNSLSFHFNLEPANLVNG